MSGSFESVLLWQRTLAEKGGPHEDERSRLRDQYRIFRDRVAKLVASLGTELPDLTVHDITHIDALWRVADQIAGPEYPINPAEAFVLGGAFLLHDSAHVMAAYEGGVGQIKASINWNDVIAQRNGGIAPANGSLEEKAALFQVLRQLHAEQAHKLPFAEWGVPGESTKLHLIENADLRNYFGNLIGEIAASHHWSPHRVADRFRDRRLTPPSYLPADWQVDALKVALLLRTADAAHIDDARAPWFLFALRQPKGISEDHWRFQTKIGQPIASKSGELQITGSPFAIGERNAWWLAYDCACMINRELRAADSLLKDDGRPSFATTSVQGASSPESFSRFVPTDGWQPIGIAPRIDDVPESSSSSAVKSCTGMSQRSRFVSFCKTRLMPFEPCVR